MWVGYGIAAPDEGHDDFAGVELSGRVALALWGAPPKLARKPGGAWLAHPAHKASAARARGARALLIATPPRDPHFAALARVPWAAPADGLPWGEGAPDAVLSDSAARAILAAAGLDPDSLRAATADGPGRAAELSGTLTLVKRVQLRPAEAWNVVAVLPGSDPAIRKELVLFTAHYDALGVGPAADGDSIYNGATESAAGAAKLLALAEALARFPGRRAVLFLAAAGGALGHLGVRHYVAHPAWPMDLTVAAISLDGGLDLFGLPREVMAPGSELSELRDLAERAARIAALRLARDDGGAESAFWTSGHLPFLFAGVPAATIAAGLRFEGKGEKWGEELRARYLAERVHRPGDEVAADFDYRGGAALAQWAYAFAHILADGDERPRWQRPVSASGISATQPPACRSAR